MFEIPNIELTVKVSKILNRNKDQFKEYQKSDGRFDFNLLIGMVLGGICNFADKALINTLIKTFVSAFDDKQLSDFANVMMELNNHLIDVLDSDPNKLCVLEDNKWVLVKHATPDSLYSLWEGFFAVIKTEFEQKWNEINSLQTNEIAALAIKDYIAMAEIMDVATLNITQINSMKHDFAKYAQHFNELRKLLYSVNAQTASATKH